MMQKVKIGDRWVGEGEPTFIIAEVGSNHDGKLDQAKKLIDVAAESGVNAVKFQLFKAENLYAKDDPMFAVMKVNELPREWVAKLKDYSGSKGLMFLASPFDDESIDYLEKVGVPAYKWASSETVNLLLLRYAACKKKPMLISTGMCDLADVSAAVEVIYAAGNRSIVLLHCTCLYPAKPNQVNLRMMDTLKDAFHLPVGLSDHTLGFVITLAAVTRGACVIEKHFTLSRKLEGPDHSYALEPHELKQMVSAIRDVEASLGSPIKDMLPEERLIARREGVTAKTAIPKGIRLTKAMVEIKRPALGIKSRFLDIVIGMKARRNIEQGEPITWDMLM